MSPDRGVKLCMVLASRLLWREWRSGELRVLAMALVIAVGSLSAVTVFTNRMDRAMIASANELLAADLVVASTEPIPESYAGEAGRLSLSVADIITFRSVVVAGDQFQLVGAKAVSEGYPLRGAVQVSDAPFGAARLAGRVPAPGHVWIDPRLANLLSLERGDALELGATRLVVDHFIAYEPDRGGEMFQIAPRVLLNIGDLPATGLIRPGSHAHYRLLLAGAAANLETMRAWLQPRLGEKESTEGVADARPEMRAALKRANQFLGLAALVSVLLSAVAIAVAAQRHASRHFDSVAVMRCFGASQSTVGGVYGLGLLGLGLGASGLGVAIGYAAQEVLSRLIGEMILADLPAPSLLPVAYGLATGLVILLGFALPPVMRLKQVPPVHVLRRDLGRLSSNTVASYLAGGAAFVLLVLWQAQDVKLAGLVLVGVAATAAALMAIAWLLVRGLGGLRDRVGVSWRFGMAAIARRADGSRLQLTAFGVGIAMMLLLGIVRSDLLEDWQRSLPPSTPNYFLVNVQPDEVEPLQAFLRSRGLSEAQLYPMVRGRLVERNRAPVAPDDYADPRAQRLAARDFNLSWVDSLQDDNRIVAGRWWGRSDHGKAMLSVEEGIAEDLGFALGDELVFAVAGQRVTARVTSLRSVEWDSFRVNFFVVFPPGVIEEMPATYISSFHLPADSRAMLADLIRAFPSVTVLDIDALLAKVRQLMEQATLAAEYVFLFTLAAGFTVLFAAIHTSLDERRYETAVVRTLGADRSQVVRSLLAEFLTLGGLAGVLAALAASLVGWVLAVEVFQLTYRPNPLLWVVGVLGGAGGIAVAGLLGTRRVVDEPPLQTLRRA